MRRHTGGCAHVQKFDDEDEGLTFLFAQMFCSKPSPGPAEVEREALLIAVMSRTLSSCE